MKINLGSGPIRHEGFVNMDASPHVNPDIVCDIEKGISLKRTRFALRSGRLRTVLFQPQ